MQKEREFFDILRCASGELHPQALCAAETMAHQMDFDIATGPQQDLDTFRLVSRWIRHVQDEQLGHAWTKTEYDRLALQEKLAALRAVPPTEKNWWGEVRPRAGQHFSDVIT